MGILDRFLGIAGPLSLPATEKLSAPQLPPLQAYESTSIDRLDCPDWLRGRATLSGVAVNDRVLLRNSTMFRGATLIAGSMGMLPLQLYRRSATGTTEKAKDHSLYRVLHKRPNGYQSPSEFKSYMQLVALMDGRACAQIVRQNGRPTDFLPLPRKAVTPKLDDRGTLRFEYRRPSGGTVMLNADEVFYFRSPISLDGLTGVGLLDIAADTVGLATLAAKAANNLLRKGVMAGGALEAPKELSDTAFGRLKESMADSHSGADNAGDWMLLEEGMTARPFSGTARDSQLMELRKYEAEEASRFTGVPRPLLMFDETSWGSGIEQLGLFFVTYCLMSWFVIWEEAIWRTLPRAEQEPSDGSLIYAKFNERALLRGSMKDQAEFMAKALGSGGGAPWIVQNEARDAFDYNPLPGGDQLPRTGTTAATAIEEDDDDEA